MFRLSDTFFFTNKLLYYIIKNKVIFYNMDGKNRSELSAFIYTLPGKLIGKGIEKKAVAVATALPHNVEPRRADSFTFILTSYEIPNVKTITIIHK